MGVTLIKLGFLCKNNWPAFFALRQLVFDGNSMFLQACKAVLVAEDLVTIENDKPVVSERVAAIVREFEANWLERTLGIP